MVAINIVTTDSTVANQFMVSTTHSATLSDDELLATLASMNKPTGLIRSEGRVWLTTDVTTEVMR